MFDETLNRRLTLIGMALIEGKRASFNLKTRKVTVYN